MTTRGARMLGLVLVLGSGACTNAAATPPSPGGGDVSLVASGQDSPSDVVADDGDVYWIDQGIFLAGSYTGGRIMRSAPGGGGLTALASDQGWPMRLVADRNGVYWLDVNAGRVMKMSKSGGGVTTIVADQAFPSIDTTEETPLRVALAVDDARVYWISLGAGDSAALMSASKVDGSGLMTLASLGAPTALAADTSGVYVVDGGQLERFDAGGGGPTVVASLDALVGTANLALDDAGVYWLWPGSAQSYYEDAAVMSKDGRSLTPLALAGGSILFGLRIDGESAYYASVRGAAAEDTEEVTLLSVPLRGGDSTALGSFSTQPIGVPPLEPLGVAVGGGHAYVTTFATQPDERPPKGDVVQIATE